MTLYLREAKRLGTELTGKDKQKFIDFSRDLAQSEDKFRLDFFFHDRSFSFFFMNELRKLQKYCLSAKLLKHNSLKMNCLVNDELHFCSCV